MKVTILHQSNTPADREIDYLKRRLKEWSIAPELVEADSRTGVALTELYDAVDRPAVLVTSDDGQLVQMWQGKLPSAELVSNLYIAT